MSPGLVFVPTHAWFSSSEGIMGQVMAPIYLNVNKELIWLGGKTSPWQLIFTHTHEEGRSLKNMQQLDVIYGSRVVGDTALGTLCLLIVEETKIKMLLWPNRLVGGGEGWNVTIISYFGEMGLWRGCLALVIMCDEEQSPRSPSEGKETHRGHISRERKLDWKCSKCAYGTS